MSVAQLLGLGTAPLGGLFSAVDDESARATIDRAWELGLRRFDTAPLYGSGLAEQRLGSALQRRRRDEFVISTKVGRLLRPGAPDPLYPGAPALAPIFDFSPDGVRRSLEESLARLQLDRVDVALIHDPEGRIDDALAAVEVLAEHCAVGVGTNEVQTALTFAREAAIGHVLLAGRYTLLDRSAEDELLPLCATLGIAVIAAGVFNSGILAGGTTFDYRPAPQHLRARARQLEDRCADYGVPLAAAALQFSLKHPAVTAVVVGARSPDEIEQNIEHATFPIPAELWQDDLIASRA